MNCTSYTAQKTEKNNVAPIDFEELNHYNYSLTPKSFVVIDTQQKMDKLFSIIHKKSSGNRLSPIPTVYGNSEETYLLFKAEVQKTNDIQIKEMRFKDGHLMLYVVPLNNPEFDQSSRTAPNVLVKILRKITISKVSVNYLTN